MLIFSRGYEPVLMIIFQSEPTPRGDQILSSLQEGALAHSGALCVRDFSQHASPLLIFHCSFIVLRYSGILATLPALFFTSAQTQFCQLATDMSQAGVVLVIASSGTIFCLRVIAIWGHNRGIIYIVSFMLLFVVGCYVSAHLLFYPLGSSSPSEQLSRSH